ncbi:metalloregulator ArsR/SmtB family transcription factor [Actinoplanes sp. HUAS TT8]|uniref:metalloregulator ArsR/SmtB family transcription factor n=1 Tax=Actinoplanes sp. HUAS TT8 TaxID=3447453 RepID=UPI003F5284DC
MDGVAGAIADPVRREILLMLRDEALTAGQVAERFAISRPAVSRHLRVLREAGLVQDTADGRRRVYELVTAPLDELAGWLGQLTGRSGVVVAGEPQERGGVGAGGLWERGDAAAGVWGRHFDALETEVHRTRRDRRRGQPEERESA